MQSAQKRSRWLLLILCLTLLFIWGNSCQPASVSGAISGKLAEVLHSILGDGGQEEASDGLLRKLAHAGEFAVLGVECCLLLCKRLPMTIPSLALAGLSVAFVDETIQRFVPGRSGEIRDMWIDFGGYATGVLLCLLVCALWNRLRMCRAKKA